MPPPSRTGMARTPVSSDLRAFDHLEQALAQALDLAEVVKVRDVAEVYRVACLKARRGITVQNRAAEIRLRAERKAGAMLAKLPRSSGGKPRQKNPVHRGPSFKDAIKDIVKPPTAKRWQVTASIDAKVFENFIRDIRASTSTNKPSELTSAALRRAWAKVKPLKSNVVTMSSNGQESSDTSLLKHEVDAWKLALLDPDSLEKMRELRAHLKVKGMADAVVALIKRAHREWISAVGR